MARLREYMENGNMWMLTLLVAKAMECPRSRKLQIPHGPDLSNTLIFFSYVVTRYELFPPEWPGQCGLGYLTPSVTSYATFNAGWISNLGLLALKVVPCERNGWGIMERPLVHHHSRKFFSVLRTSFQSFVTCDWERKSLHSCKKRPFPVSLKVGNKSPHVKNATSAPGEQKAFLLPEGGLWDWGDCINKFPYFFINLLSQPQIP